MDAFRPVTLVGRWVRLEPLRADHRDGIARAAAQDRSTFGFTWVPEGTAQTVSYIESRLRDAAAGQALPFVQRRTDEVGDVSRPGRADGSIVGCTSFLEPRSWRGRSTPDEVEIGGTWLAKDAQRSPINTEAKLLLLTHAFETWVVDRVAICTDERNQRSRVAIERLGATFEGVLRSHRASRLADETGRARNTAMYSITAEDWEPVKARLADRLTT